MNRSSKKKRSATMNEVAKRAGVSQTTVSFVINNRPDARVSDETRARIWAVVEELGYRPNAAAKSLKTSRSGIIGFIADEIATTPFAGNIIKGAQDAAREHGKILLLIDTNGDIELEETAIEVMLERQVEALLYSTMYHHAVTVPSALYEVPCVLVDCFSEDRSLPSVVPDEVQGGYEATKVLLERGHQRIGFINQTIPLIQASHGRLKGYQKALAEYGIVYDNQYVRGGENTSGSGFDATLELLQLAEPPTAIFCFTDRVAMGAYDAIRQLNLRVPSDVAIIGFDNLEIITENLHPSLSSMQLPHYEMGQWAVNYLMESIQDGQHGTDSIQHKLPCPYVERQST